MNSPSPRRPIGQILIAQGVISEDQLRIALLEQMKSNQPVGKLLVALGFVSEATLRDALGESLGKKAVDLAPPSSTRPRCAWCRAISPSATACCR
jgi:hypothetical protein